MLNRAGFRWWREYVGHGIGRDLHEEPAVPNFGTAGRGILLQKGMVLAIEPMVNIGTWKTRLMPDQWTVVTEDGSLSSHFEHSIAILEDGPEILTSEDTASHIRLKKGGGSTFIWRRNRR